MDNRILSVSAVLEALSDIQTALDSISTDCIGQYASLSDEMSNAWSSNTANTVKEKITAMDTDLTSLKTAVENMKAKINAVIQSVQNVNATTINSSGSSDSN